MTWWWLSFYNQQDHKFAGVLLLEARCIEEAMYIAGLLGGRGYIRAQPMSEEECQQFPIPEDMKHRLLNELEARALDTLWQRFMTQKEA